MGRMKISALSGISVDSVLRVTEMSTNIVAGVDFQHPTFLAVVSRLCFGCHRCGKLEVSPFFMIW